MEHMESAHILCSKERSLHEMKANVEPTAITSELKVPEISASPKRLAEAELSDDPAKRVKVESNQRTTQDDAEQESRPDSNSTAPEENPLTSAPEVLLDGTKKEDQETPLQEEETGLAMFITKSFREAYRKKHADHYCEKAMEKMASKVWHKMSKADQEDYEQSQRGPAVSPNKVLTTVKGESSGSKAPAKRRPTKSPFDFFLMGHIDRAKLQGTKIASKQEIRTQAKATWEELDAEAKLPYEKQSQAARQAAKEASLHAKQLDVTEPAEPAVESGAQKSQKRQRKTAYEHYISSNFRKTYREENSAIYDEKEMRKAAKLSWDSLSDEARQPYEQARDEAAVPIQALQQESAVPVQELKTGANSEQESKTIQQKKQKQSKSAFEFFVQVFTKECKAELTALTDRKEIRKLARTRWEAMDADLKRPYQAKAQEAKEAKDLPPDNPPDALEPVASKSPESKQDATLAGTARVFSTKPGDWKARKRTTAYDVFAFHYKQDSDKKGSVGVNKAWKDLDNSERKKYEAKAAKMPTPAPTATVLFFEDFKAECEHIFPNTPEEEARIGAMECWEDLHDEVKQPYSLKQQAEAEAYQLQMASVPLLS